MRKKNSINSSPSNDTLDRPGCRIRARSQTNDRDTRHVSPRSGGTEPRLSRSSTSSVHHSPGHPGIGPGKKQLSPTLRRSFTNDQHGQSNTSRGWANGHHLPPIPASPYPTEPSTPTSRKSATPSPASGKLSTKERSVINGAATDTEDGSLSRSRSKSSSYIPYRSPVPQSLNAAMEMLSLSERRSTSEHGHFAPLSSVVADTPRKSTSSTTPPKDKSKERRDLSLSPTKSSLGPSHGAFWMVRSSSTPPPPTVNGKAISNPVVNQGGYSDFVGYHASSGVLADAALNMSPIKNRGSGKPIPVARATDGTPSATLASGFVPRISFMWAR